MSDSHDSLGDRIKSYEELSTSRQLMPNCPVYARIDGRAFHTFCRGLEKPFSRGFIEVMKETCKFLVEETNACIGYVQSDEISLGWENIDKAPFGGRVQKLESNLASLASAKFVQYIVSITPDFKGPLEYDYKTKEEYREARAEYCKVSNDNRRMSIKIDKTPPSFDCRVFNVPTMTELANCFLWRENDAIKNSITGMALSFFSHNQIQGKSGEEKIDMMKEKGYDFYRDTEPAFLRGTFFHRELYRRVLTDEEVARIPEKQRDNLEKQVITYGDAGNREKVQYSCIRSHVVEMKLPYRLTDTYDVDKVLFHGDMMTCNKDNPTFKLEFKE